MLLPVKQMHIKSAVRCVNATPDYMQTNVLNQQESGAVPVITLNLLS